MNFSTSWLLRVVAAIAVIAMALFARGVVPSYATLGGGTTFEGNDGNLITNGTTGNTDWASFVNASGVPNGTGAAGSPLLHAGIDQASGSGDNSFGQGTKEDNSTVTVVSGSIPPNKSDLTRFYEASDLISNQIYLYLGWERSNVLGSANMDFEINQNNTNACPGTTAGACTIARSNGDVLVTYDFGGSGTPTIGILRWLTVGGTNPYDSTKTNVVANCFSANALPCWGDQRTISTANSEGAVNGVSVTDPILPSGQDACPTSGSVPTCAAGTFGETAINLTGAGVITSSNACNFGSATTFLKSRSSSSFTAEAKDFVAPVATPIISQCGTLTVIKQTSPRGLNQSFGFTSDVPGNSTFSLNDTGNTGKTLGSTAAAQNSAGNTRTMTDIHSGTYHVSENAPDPSGFGYDSVACTSSTGSSSSTTGDNTATQNGPVTINLAASDAVTCLYQNDQQLGAIKVTKLSVKAATPLNNAVFDVCSSSTCPGASNANLLFQLTTSGTGASAGTACQDNLAFGTYYVKEITAPSGYAIDDATAAPLTVNSNAQCNDATYVGASKSFTDTPLTDLTVHVASEAAGGTQSKISCVDGSSAGIGNSPQPASGYGDPETVTANGLQPGTYTCTVVVDP